MRTNASRTPVWEGPDVLRPFLVPIDSLEPFPGNPRRGDVPSVMKSLNRFGQVKPIVVDGSRIVAGHHVVLASRENGWSHIAAIPNDFADEDEARAFLLADNRTSDLGAYDQALLVRHLKALAEKDALEGTGYTTDDLDQHLADLRRQIDAADGEQKVVSFVARDKTGQRELVLLYSPAQLERLQTWLGIVGHERGVDGASERVYIAAELAARQLNQGE